MCVPLLYYSIRNPNPYLVVPVTITTHWYDNYGLPVLQQLRDLMRSK